MKPRLKEMGFVSTEEIQAEPQKVLNTLTPADFNGCFQKWQIDGIVLCKPKVTTSKVTVGNYKVSIRAITGKFSESDVWLTVHRNSMLFGYLTFRRLPAV